MRTSSAPGERAAVAALRPWACRLLRARRVTLRPLRGGRNSRVVLAAAPGGGRLVLKRYPPPRPGRPSALAVEFGALGFLWRHGVRCIPEPVAADPRRRRAAYAFVPGGAVVPGEAGAADVDFLADFLVSLRDLAGREGSAELPSAAEACFSLRELAASLHGRLAALEAAAAGPRVALAELRAFLADGLRPTLGRALAQAEDLVDAEAVLPKGLRTLSPSDYGLHNALRRSDGGLTLLDFEYFGWDDPAKAVSDVLLHPAMALSAPLRARFARRVVAGFAADRGLPARLGAVYPLFGLKWCVILLNEFVPEHLRRRRFAGDRRPLPELLGAQLAKARSMLGVVGEALGAARRGGWRGF